MTLLWVRPGRPASTDLVAGRQVAVVTRRGGGRRWPLVRWWSPGGGRGGGRRRSWSRLLRAAAWEHRPEPQLGGLAHDRQGAVLVLHAGQLHDDVVLPWRLMSGSATPRASTRLRMIEIDWSSTSVPTVGFGVGARPTRRPGGRGRGWRCVRRAVARNATTPRERRSRSDRRPADRTAGLVPVLRARRSSTGVGRRWRHPTGRWRRGGTHLDAGARRIVTRSSVTTIWPIMPPAVTTSSPTEIDVISVTLLAGALLLRPHHEHVHGAEQESKEERLKASGVPGGR